MCRLGQFLIRGTQSLNFRHLVLGSSTFNQSTNYPLLQCYSSFLPNALARISNSMLRVCLLEIQYLLLGTF